MRRIIDYFFPHEDNDFKPHLLREAGVVMLAGIVLVVFLVAVSGRILFPRSEYGAAVLSAVLVDLTNSDRSLYSLGQLKPSPLLEEAARLKVEDMVTRGYFAHNSPDGLTPWHWLNKAGYDFSYAGENLAVNFSESVDIDRAWMNSPLHRENILNGNFSEMGIAVKEGMYEGRPTIFVVQLFGRPVAPEFAEFVESVETVEPLISDSEDVITTEDIESTSSTPLIETNTEMAIETPAQVLGAEETSELYIAVKKNSAPAQVVIAETTEVSKYSAFLVSLSSPSKILKISYTIIAALIMLLMITLLTSEIKKHHVSHVVYSIALILFMFALVYLYRELLFAPLQIL